MPRESAGGTGATAFRLSPSGIVQPLPDLPLHFTIPTRKHTPQLILPQWNDFLELTRRLAPFTVFYNGPRSGASAPDHAHFQAVTRGIMPLDEEVTQFIRHPYASVYDTVYSRSPETSAPASSSKPPPPRPPPGSSRRSTPPCRFPGEPEPMMNIFGSYYDNNWVITVILVNATARGNTRPRATTISCPARELPISEVFSSPL